MPSRNEYESRPDPTIDYIVNCPLASKIFMIPPFLGCLLSDPSRVLAGNEDMHKSLDDFEFQPDPTTDYGVG